LPLNPDQRVVAEFNLEFPGGVPLGVFAINGRDFSTFKSPDLPPLFSVANGLKTSELPVTANAISIPLDKHIEVVLVNLMTDQHPFHMHSHAPWVVASGQASREDIFSGVISSQSKLTGPIKRDVYTVPPCNVDDSGACVGVGFLVLRFDTDNPGAWMLHCHVEWHMDIGMSMLFVEGEKELQDRGIKSFSSSMLNTCAGAYAA
jgi:iron transport multicopper oxidase